MARSAEEELSALRRGRSADEELAARHGTDRAASLQSEAQDSGRLTASTIPRSLDRRAHHRLAVTVPALFYSLREVDHNVRRIP